MRAASGQYVPLADIVTVDRRSGFSTIRRDNGVMLISVTAGLADDDADRASDIMSTIQDEILPKLESDFGVATNMAGLSEQENAFLSDALTGLILCLIGIFLTLAWIFSSWTRPVVVMAIIPFGLVGTVWGHYIWGIPMSLFTVVGMIGMVGIIINDSIVLVTTIDEYSETRGLIPAIIDGTSDRLRPVFLTTATTVLGLAPLLYEGSNQAEFLKPTVVTLVYGLGFGMVLVLMVVPALMAMQDDWARQVGAARRALKASRDGSLPARVSSSAGAVVSFALFAALILPVVVTGAAWPVLAEQLPFLAGGFGPALALFAAVLAVVLVVIYAITGLVGRKRPKPA